MSFGLAADQEREKKGQDPETDHNRGKNESLRERVGESVDLSVVTDEGGARGIPSR